MGDDVARFSKLFGALDENERKRLTSLSKKEQFQPGDVICREGEQGADFFVLVKGTVTVTSDDFGTAKQLATLGPGQFFGEMAALAGQPRQATVTAAEPVDLVRIPLSAVNEVLKASPRANEVLQKAGLARMEDTLKKMME
jgi:CRP-like cAMP-binding protein